ncbi:MAG TPA: phosphatase PAP2 family protein [Acidimicrobiales bacterium]|nr:phosphatase PAP2 family protein [Acidimicrobiales bacterium]
MTTADRGDAPGLGALPKHAEARKALPQPEGWWAEVNSLDLAVYAAIAATPTPTLDGVFRRLSRAADNSKLWIASAAVLATVGGPVGRRAAVNGLASVAVTSAVVNLGLKRLGRRHRPDRATHHVPLTRQVTMPRTTSFPSGHAASASAFATGVASAAPEAGIPVSTAATLVAYSRVHTGVHYPVDVIAGSLTGEALALLTVAALARRRRRRVDA